VIRRRASKNRVEAKNSARVVFLSSLPIKNKKRIPLEML
jgi:hypothetical protein